jgi:hypothetical protein
MGSSAEIKGDIYTRARIGPNFDRRVINLTSMEITEKFGDFSQSTNRKRQSSRRKKIPYVKGQCQEVDGKMAIS